MLLLLQLERGSRAAATRTTTSYDAALQLCESMMTCNPKDLDLPRPILELRLCS